MSKYPAFQFYPADYLADANVALMPLEAEGAYIRLMAYCWREDGLPTEMEKLAKLCRVSVEKMQELWPYLENCFVSTCYNSASVLHHPRLEKEKRKQKEYSKTKSVAGKKGAEKRWASASEDNSTCHSSAIDLPLAKNSFSSSISSSIISNTPLPPEGDVDGFEIFWKAYPKKTAKEYCERIWKRKHLSAKVQAIADTVERYKASPDWKKDNGRYIPNPSTFLNQGRWLDEVPQQAKPEWNMRG